MRLTGALREGVLADRPRADASPSACASSACRGEFVEFFGPGVSTLSAGERAVVANMAPEYGASTGYFPIDEQTLDYLRATGRTAAQLALVAAYAKRQSPLVRSGTPSRATRDMIEIDLDRIGTSLAGPRRPQDRLSPDQTRRCHRDLWMCAREAASRGERAATAPSRSRPSRAARIPPIPA